MGTRLRELFDVQFVHSQINLLCNSNDLKSCHFGVCELLEVLYIYTCSI